VLLLGFRIPAENRALGELSPDVAGGRSDRNRASDRRDVDTKGS
jgi:hypothetical protein